VTDGDEPEEQRRQELLMLYFESFKHFTTLAVAAAVVLLAVYGEGIADQTLLAIALGMFGLAVLFAVIGMSQVLYRFRTGEGLGRAPRAMIGIVTSLFGGECCSSY
jgi:hypothetical protein